MKVAMLALIAWRTPPRHHGPWELVTSLLSEGVGYASPYSSTMGAILRVRTR